MKKFINFLLIVLSLIMMSVFATGVLEGDISIGNNNTFLTNPTFITLEGVQNGTDVNFLNITGKFFSWIVSPNSTVLARFNGSELSLDINSTVDNRISVSQQTFTPFNLTVVVGTQDQGNITGVRFIDDGIELNISEVTGATGFQLIFNFTGVTEFTNIQTHMLYSGSLAHIIDIELFNFDTNVYDDFGDISESDDFMIQNFPVSSDDDYKNKGNVSLRLTHTSAGNPTHDLFIDLIELQRTAQVTRDHGSLTGIEDDDHLQYLDTLRHDDNTLHNYYNNFTIDYNDLDLAWKLINFTEAFNDIYNTSDSGLWSILNFTNIHTDNTIHNYYLEENFTEDYNDLGVSWKLINFTTASSDLIKNNTDVDFTDLTIGDKINLSSTGDINGTKFYGNYTGTIQCDQITGSPDNDFCTDADTVGSGLQNGTDANFKLLNVSILNVTNGLLHIVKSGSGGAIKLERTDGSDSTFTITNSADEIEFDYVGGSAGYQFQIESVDIMKILENGNVGIGVDDPDNPLEVDGNLHISGIGNLILENGEFVTWRDNGGILRSTITTDSSDNVIIGSNNLDDVILKVGTLSSAVWIKDITGRVGIGTGSPTTILDISSPINNLNTTRLRLSFSETGTYNTNDILGGIDFFVKDSSGQYPAVANAINSVHTGTNGQSAPRAGLSFFTNENTAIPLERMRILANGDVGIGTPTPEVRLHIKDTAGASVFIQSAVGSASGVGIQRPDGAEGRVHCGATVCSYLYGHGSAFVVAEMNAGSQVTDDTFPNQIRIFLADVNLFHVNSDMQNTSFQVSGSTTKNLFVINSSTEKVGIGLNDPAEALEIDGNLTFTESFDKKISIQTGGSPADLYLMSGGAGGGSGGNIILDASGAIGDGDILIVNNLGIGTDSPSAKLDVVGTSKFNGNMVLGAISDLQLVDGLVEICNLPTCSFTTATGDGDLGVEGDVEIGGVLDLDASSDSQFTSTANTACSTQCGSDACLSAFAISGASQVLPVSCSDATADFCFCSN